MGDHFMRPISREVFVKSAVFLWALTGCAAAKSHSWNDLPNRFDSAKALKTDLEWVVKSWNLRLDRVNYCVCHQVFPSLGQSKEWVHAWREEPEGTFVLVWSYRSSGVGALEVEVDEKMGVVLVRGVANTDWKGLVIASAHLGPT